MNWALFTQVMAAAFALGLASPVLGRIGSRPGLWMACYQLDRERQREAMAALQLDMAHWRTAPASRSRGLAQYVASPQRGGLPGECWQRGVGWVSLRHSASGPVARAWLCPVCHHGNHPCTPQRCRCPDGSRW